MKIANGQSWPKCFFSVDENVRCRVDGDRRGLLVAALEPAITAQIYIGSPMVHSCIDFGIPCAYTYNTTLLNIVMGRVSIEHRCVT